VAERNPYKVWLEFNNYQSPTVGAERGLITVADENLTGHGDILSVQYGRSAGVDVQLDASYTLPVTARDTLVIPRYRRNTFLVVEAPFQPLDVNSESEIYGITLRQPVYRTLNQEFALELTGERLSSRTFLLDQPFSFSPGAHRGLSTDTAVRLVQEWTGRTPTQVLAARSRFSVGIDALGATINPSPLPDGRFFAWLGQLQWVRRVSAWDIEMLFRTDLQLAKDPLLPLEQIAVGGRYSVRGYRENQLVRDNGFLASVESRIPVIRERRWAEIVQVAPFVDIGRAWNTSLPTPAPTTLASIGLGLRWAATVASPFPMRPQFEVYWGVPLNHVKTPGGNLQDYGLHLQLVVALF
jgi:hemolysin activation/secretion protein